MSLLKVNEIQVFNGTTVTITATTAVASADLTVTDDLDVGGALTLGTALAIAEGGTGATTASAARTALDVDQAGTDNSTDVTLAGSLDYLTISGQEITRNAIDLTTDVTGALPAANGGTGVTALSSLDAADLGSGAATDGYVLTADGSGGAAWEVVTPNLEGGVVINNTGADVDFRVESNTDENALFVQGSDGYVGIGVASPANKLHVDGNIQLNSGNVIVSSGYGIDFSATADSPYGTKSSELLDDYEEGSFTPVFQGATTAGTYTPATTIGRYVKIGSIVYVAITLLDIATTNAGSGNVEITGLPFKSVNISPLQHTGKALLSRFTLTGGGSDDGFLTFLANDSNAFQIIKPTTGASGTGYVLNVTDKASDSADIFVSFTYYSS